MDDIELCLMSTTQHHVAIIVPSVTDIFSLRFCNSWKQSVTKHPASMSSTIAITATDFEGSTVPVCRPQTTPLLRPSLRDRNTAPVLRRGLNKNEHKDLAKDGLSSEIKSLSVIELEDRIEKTQESIGALERILIRNSKPFLLRFMRRLRVDRNNQPGLKQYYKSFLAEHGQDLGPTLWNSDFAFGLYLHEQQLCSLLAPTDTESWRITYLRFPTIQEINEIAPAVDGYDLGILESRTPTSLDNPVSGETQTQDADDAGFNTDTGNTTQNTHDDFESVRTVGSQYIASTTSHGGSTGSDSDGDDSDSDTSTK
ncbi:hypothetical protein F5Y18DRAFT_296242 [Xylariaceae sp. FL1019]|nr:hypothetical protein F5Y18DRAFT_296242 [Xylariaceae sp. FL1019]